jgi:serine protease Do
MLIRTKTLGVSAVGLLAVGAVTGLSAQALLHPQTSQSAPTAPTAPTTPSSPTAVHLVPPTSAPNYRAIVAENEAAVVGVTTAGVVPTSNDEDPSLGEQGPGMGGPDDQNPLSQFFHNMPVPHPRVMHAQGSGFIISPDGLVLTNAHVVNGAKQVTVKLSDHREYKAKVLGLDRSSDIAVLKIDATGLPTVQLGNSDNLGVGDYVLAIGEPFGLEETATAGIVSAKGRTLPGDGYVPFIQTDAAVNPGNSGGPLFDANGAVVGINAQIYSNSGGYQGVSFAIPINIAMQVEHQIIKTGKVTHARLGVEVQTLDQSLADSFKLKSPNGALVAQVEPDSAAAHAGIKVGDVILKFNGHPIVDAGQLSAQVGVATPGDQATIDIWRDGKTQSLTATIGSASAATVADAANSPVEQGKLGLALRPLSPTERQQAGVPGGLMVEAAKGHAADAGIQPGDVVLSVDGNPVQSVEQLRKMIGSHDAQVALLIQRGNMRLFIPVGLG